MLSEVKTVKKKFTTTLDDKLIKEMKIQAIKENISVSALIEKLFDNYMNN
jgi:predicted HicB family RNase H-like nuclease